MRTTWLVLSALCLLPAVGWADGAATPWAASAQAPTAFAVPMGQDPAVMAQAVSLLDGWKDRDSRMYPMPIRTLTPTLIQTEDPTALGLFGVKITDTHTAGIALIAVEASAYEGKVFSISQQRHDANKRARLLAYLLEQSAGMPTAPPPPVAVPPTPMDPAASTTPSVPQASAAPAYGPAMRRLQAQLDAGQYAAALATLDALRADITADQAKNAPTTK